MWQPDGTGWRARIGVLSTHPDVVPESELQAMAPRGVSIHATRAPLDVVNPGGSLAEKLSPTQAQDFADQPLIYDAADLLAAAPLQAIIYGFTSSSYRLGPDGDAAFQARLELRTRGIPVVIPCISTALALRTLGARRFALIGPPWYESELNRMGAEYFRGQGFDAVYAASVDLPGGGKLEDWKTGLHVEPGHLYKWIRAHVPQNADVIFIGGNGMRTIGAIQALEEDLGRPVLTATQVAFWHALHLVGVRATISNYGQIFTKELPLQDAEEL